MNRQSETVELENRQAILDEIAALLETPRGIDEARAKKVRKAVDALRSSDAAPDDVEDEHATDSGLDAKIDAGLETLRTRIHKQVERRNRDYEKALALAAEMESALKDNELQQAERAYSQVMSLMGNMPGLSEQRWQDIDKRLNRVRPRLRKLESWRHWGTTQARQELIDQITQLITDPGMPPAQLARRIQAAREQWTAWDKLGDQAGKELWQAFDKACKEAWKPCAVHFKKLKEQRAQNLVQRRAVIERLNERYTTTDWKAPDWREIDRFVRQARRDFYRIGNVEFRHRKKLARTLDEALEKFEEHLSRERSRSLRVREKLINDIEALGKLDDLRSAYEQIEVLKKQWHVTVTGKRELENKLWKRFQDACDITYRRRAAERREQDAGRNENLQQKRALIDELARTAAAGDGELLASAALPARLQQRWEEIGPVSRKEEKGLDTRWRDARKRFRGALKAAEYRARAAEFDNLARRAALCHQWEQALLAGGAIDAQSANAEWVALPALSGAGAETMEQRFAQALDPPDATALSENLARKQAACLRLEVMLDLDSPPDCQAERMAYQVERLNASLKKELGSQESVEDLLRAVLTTGAVPATAATAIEQRIHDCLTRYKQR